MTENFYLVTWLGRIPFPDRRGSRPALCLLLLLSLAQAVYAQKSRTDKAQQYFVRAQQSLQEKNDLMALQQLREAVLADPGFQSAFIQLGDVYRIKKDFRSARDSYLRALALPQAKPDTRLYYVLGESELHCGEYNNALDHFLTFKKNRQAEEEIYQKKTDKYILDCKFAIAALLHPAPYHPKNLGPLINTRDREYLPTLTADGSTMIFSRTTGGNEDFYLSKFTDRTWQTAMPLSDEINTAYNEGAQSISPDGMFLFFTGCNRPDGAGSCDLYVSHKNGNRWEKPFNLGPTVNSSFWDSQPAISPDGNTLYFVSNRPGGIGGYDIWKTQLDAEGNWGKPENLGPDINTPWDENTPFLYQDGRTLYFSSNGWPGLGNMDVFYSRRKDDGSWEKPVNMGYPINTFSEETGLVVGPDGTTGYLSAILEGGYGDMDLYSFEMPEAARPAPVTYVKGLVRDKSSHQYLEAKIEVTDLKTGETKFNDYTSAEDGAFLAVMPLGSNYALNASADGYLFHSARFELKGAPAGSPYTLTIELEKLRIGADLILQNVFFETGAYVLLPASKTELTTLLGLLNDNRNLEIEIQGHTDNIGSTPDNERLSLQRAKAVFDYLVAKQISPARLRFKGYGAEKPVASNQRAEGRQQNRRTSFIVTKF